MNLEWSAADLAFRDEVRAFLDKELTPELRLAGRLMTSVYADHEASMEWQRILHERGWAAPAWPVAHGGCDWSLTRHYIFSRESTLAGAPSLSPMGIRMVAHAIITFGTDEQKDYFLPRILTGEVFFCQGYSEPEAGSDLAALSMAARDDGDHLVCTGSKIWTTHAQEANWMFALVRTTRTEKKQRGITFVAKYLLEFERGGGAVAPALQVMAEGIAEVAAEQPGAAGGRLLDDPTFARKLADLRIRTEVLEILEYQVLAVVADGGNPGAKSSMLKVLGTELSQAITELAMEAAGPRGRVYQPHATYPGGPIADFEPPAGDYVSGEPWQAVAPLRYFNDRAGSIYAGSNEIQRNILAKAALGL